MEFIPEKNTPILIVDDDTSLLMSMKAILMSAGFPEPALVSDPRRVMSLLRKHTYQLILIDLIMPHFKGMDLLEEIKRNYPFIECIIITAVDDVSSAVKAMRFGAFDYLVKPIKREKLLITINNALEKFNIRYSISVLERSPKFSDIRNLSAFGEMVAMDDRMAVVFSQAETFASSDYNLLLTGETGTGKDMLARIVHRMSNRAEGPFIAINMGAFSKTLVEDELFGHAKGAFTGATHEREGFFEKARGGTIFLDEISEMDQDVQGKLLRVIQEREMYRLGSTDKKGLDIRIIAATNRNIDEEVNQGRFRKDLYYRLNVCRINIPPLRKRKKDILPLANHFLEVHSVKNKRYIKCISKELESYLEEYFFPGNVRELENMIIACILNEKTDILRLPSAEDLWTFAQNPIKNSKEMELMKEIEKEHIIKAMEMTKGNRTNAAKILGISLRTLQRKLKTYKVK